MSHSPIQPPPPDTPPHPPVPLLLHIAPPLPPSPPQQSPVSPRHREAAFLCVVPTYNNLKEHRIFSSWHVLGSYRWRLMIFPSGNHSTDHMSVYVECGGPACPDYVRKSHKAYVQWLSDSGKDKTWKCGMTFWLHVVHPSSPLAKMAFKHQTAGCLSMFDVDVSDADVDAYLGETADIVKSSSHMFRPTMRDWGFLEFAPFEELQPNKYTDDSQNVTVMVRMRLSQAPYDSDFVLNHPDSDSDP